MEAVGNGTITVTFSEDEALVLFDWLARLNDREMRTEQNDPETRLLFDLESVFEKHLPQVLAKDYAELVERARQALGVPSAE